jgi:signal transduction histidine kinase
MRPGVGRTVAGHDGRPLGSLGLRLLLAFVAVALSSVVVLTVAALVGTDQGLAAVQRADREQATARVARAVALAYTEAGGWAGANLTAASAAAEAAGAQLSVRDTTGVMVWPGRGLGMGGIHGQGGGQGGGPGAVSAPVLVAGDTVGTVRLGFGSAITAGRQVAWEWVVGAGVVALLVALAVSWGVTRWLTGPLAALAGAARAFARGDRAARSGVRGPGELGAVGVALDHLAEEVVTAETVRRRLSADVAHELRTPLAALQAGLEELRDGFGEPDFQRLGALHDQALRLGRIVDDLAELSAAEAAALRLDRRDLDLAVVVEQALDERRPQLRAAGLVVRSDIHGPLPVCGDADRLHQAIGNLLANAARYCRAGDEVLVRAVVDGGCAVVEVADTGPGIDPADLPHVFERLWRGRVAGSVAGSGIGLAVVRELVAAHGGSVSADATDGGGARFTIRLPLSGGA